MSAVDRVLAEHCFEPDGDGRWYSNGRQIVRLDPNGRWQVFEPVAEGREAEELARRAHHPRWLDDPFGDPLPAPKLSDDELRQRIVRLPTRALRSEARRALADGQRDRAKSILARYDML